MYFSGEAPYPRERFWESNAMMSFFFSMVLGGIFGYASERLGFTGREEGIAALATAALVRG